MRNKKNIRISGVQIEGMADEGRAVARIDGCVTFIKGAVPEDIVEVRITKKKKAFWEGQVVNIEQPSKYRKTPFCSHFGICGGCKWQYLDYEQQLAYKQQQVVDALRRIAKVEIPEVSPILPSEKTQYYRNKLEFTFSNRRWLYPDEIQSDEKLNRNALGFHVPGRFDKILAIDHCYLQEEPSNTIRDTLRDYVVQHGLTFFDLVHQNGLMRNLIIRTSIIGEVMVIVQFAQKSNEIKGVLDHLKATIPSITSLYSVVNTKGNDTFHDLDLKLHSGKAYIEEVMEDLNFRIGPKSFFQTNSLQALELYKEVRKMAKLTGNEVVYDLYTGTGTIANFIAKQAAKVIGLEYVPEAIVDAKINSETNKISNTSFFAGDIKDLLNDDFFAKNGRPDVIITDPPRAGMHELVTAEILKVEPKRIIYVSCNPATQARDLALLDEKYKICEVQPVDMFPHTHHVENIVSLELRTHA